MLEGFRGEVRASELCRREGIRSNFYHAWLTDFVRVRRIRRTGRVRLQADTARDDTEAEVEALKRGNERLKKAIAPSVLVAELSLQNHED